MYIEQLWMFFIVVNCGILVCTMFYVFFTHCAWFCDCNIFFYFFTCLLCSVLCRLMPKSMYKFCFFLLFFSVFTETQSWFYFEITHYFSLSWLFMQAFQKWSNKQTIDEVPKTAAWKPNPLVTGTKGRLQNIKGDMD